MSCAPPAARNFRPERPAAQVLRRRRPSELLLGSSRGHVGGLSLATAGLRLACQSPCVREIGTMGRTNVRILVVDDDVAARTALASLLETQGYQVDSAGDGQAALERLVELPPDTIVTDLDMPVMNGMQLIGELRSRGLDVPAIVVTSATEVRSAVEAMRAGATDYITKPVDFDALLLS